MDPRVLADWLKKGVENEQFLVIPYPSGPRMVEMALERFVDYASPEGMKRLEEKQKQPPTEEELRMMSEREGYDVSKRPFTSVGKRRRTWASARPRASLTGSTPRRNSTGN